MTTAGVLAAITALVMVGACDPPSSQPRWRPAGATAPARGGTLRIATTGAIATLDPSIAYDEVTGYALHHLVDTLVDYDRDGVTLVPRLAARWEVGDGGRSYRFWLRPGLTYEDGRPIVAADFKTSLERALTTVDSPFGSFLADVEGAEAVAAGTATSCAGIIAASDQALEIRLVRPSAVFAYVLAMPFAGPQRADHVGAPGVELRRGPLASGPYRVERWAEGEQLVLRRRDGYHDDRRGWIERLVLREHVPRDTQFLMFERGELDAIDRLAGPDYLWIVAQPAWQPYLSSRALMNVFGSRMNVRRAPFDDRRVRQAFNLALDKGHTHKLLHGTTVPSHGMLAPGVVGRDDRLAPYPHDPARARALLAAAGYPDGLAVDYVTVADDEAQRLAQSLQADLAEAGIRVSITVLSWPAYLTAVGKADGPALSFTSWIADYPDPSNFLDVRFHSRAITDDASTNDSFYANPELDALLDAARAELDPARRAASYRRAERILFDDAPWIWDYHRTTTEVTQPYVRDYAIHPVWIRDYTSAWLDLGPDGQRVSR